MCQFSPTNSSTLKIFSEIQCGEAREEHGLGRQRLRVPEQVRLGYMAGGLCHINWKKKKTEKIEFVTDK